MAQLRWRIDALKNFSRSEKERSLLPLKGESLTGAASSATYRELTFDELYEMQRRKFGALKERRRSKVSDPKYLEMIGNMQLRKEKRKHLSKAKLEEQMKALGDAIQPQD